MVCGTLGASAIVPAPGVWAVEHRGMEMNGYCWQSPMYNGVQGYDMWADQSTNFVSSFAIPDAISDLQPEGDSAPKTPNSTSADSAESIDSASKARKQTGGRAAKRQRGRERRKLYKALRKLETGFDERYAAVATELKLVVKSTFYDVSDQANEVTESEVPLPAPFFPTTKEFDQWRREYRRFRLGHHHGAKGEVTSELFHADCALQWLDLRSAAHCQPRPVAALAA